MKHRPHSNIKFKLEDKQRSFLQKILDEGFKLTSREEYVVSCVLKTGEYHENYKYHLNKIGKRYKKNE